MCALGMVAVGRGRGILVLVVEISVLLLAMLNMHLVSAMDVHRSFFEIRKVVRRSQYAIRVVVHMGDCLAILLAQLQPVVCEVGKLIHVMLGPFWQGNQPLLARYHERIVHARLGIHDLFDDARVKGIMKHVYSDLLLHKLLLGRHPARRGPVCAVGQDLGFERGVVHPVSVLNDEGRVALYAKQHVLFALRNVVSADKILPLREYAARIKLDSASLGKFVSILHTQTH